MVIYFGGEPNDSKVGVVVVGKTISFFNSVDRTGDVCKEGVGVIYLCLG